MTTAVRSMDEWQALPGAPGAPGVCELPTRIFQSSDGGALRRRAVRGTHDQSRTVEEPDEVKVSRPVLKPGGGGDPAAQVN